MQTRRQIMRGMSHARWALVLSLTAILAILIAFRASWDSPISVLAMAGIFWFLSMHESLAQRRREAETGEAHRHTGLRVLVSLSASIIVIGGVGLIEHGWREALLFAAAALGLYLAERKRHSATQYYTAVYYEKGRDLY